MEVSMHLFYVGREDRFYIVGKSLRKNISAQYKREFANFRVSQTKTRMLSGYSEGTHIEAMEVWMNLMFIHSPLL